MPELSTADHSQNPPVLQIPRRYNAANDLIERNLRAVSFFFHVGTFRLPWRHKPSGIETDERLVSSMNINLQ